MGEHTSRPACAVFIGVGRFRILGGQALEYWGAKGGGAGKGYAGPPLTLFGGGGGGLYMYMFAFIILVLNRQIVRFCFTILPEVLNGRLCYV